MPGLLAALLPVQLLPLSQPMDSRTKKKITKTANVFTRISRGIAEEEKRNIELISESCCLRKSDVSSHFTVQAIEPQ